jgi:predicted O-methyltransferase YrrM
MEFLDKNLSDYAEMHTTAEREVLKDLNRETWSNVMMPRMLSGHLQGRFLSFISHMMRPKCILEIGTYTGYSAICLAEGLAENGVLHTIDVNEELEPMVKKYIKESGYETKIKTYFEPAVDVIPRLTEAIDLVFIDADKENYALYFDLVIDKVRPGGIIAADNVLWSGKVLDEKALQKDKETMALDAYNKKVMQDSRVENILVPIRDGIMLARKL